VELEERERERERERRKERVQTPQMLMSIAGTNVVAGSRAAHWVPNLGQAPLFNALNFDARLVMTHPSPHILNAWYAD
jgi:hypothetical protein